MLNVIKTAIITIIISFISGLLLDYYKNLAPRILCNIRNVAPIKLNGRKICAYIVTVSNVSKKTIHELNLNIQSSRNSLKITDAKITKGLKFDSSIKDKIIDIHIPFLSKGDKFSVKVCVENQQAVNSKPIVVLRSPENFKRISSIYQLGFLSSLFNRTKSTNQPITNAVNRPVGTDKRLNRTNKKPGASKKAVLIVVSIILVMIVGVIVKSYFKGTSNNTQTPAVNTNVSKQSTGSSRSSDGTTGNTNKTPASGTSENKNTGRSSSGSYDNTGSKSSTGSTGTGTSETESSDSSHTGRTNTPSTGSYENSHTGTGTTTTPSTGSSSTGTVKQSGESSGTTGNSDTKSSSGESSGNSGNQTSSGSTGNTSN